MEGPVLRPLRILADSIGFLFGHFPAFFRLAAVPVLLLGLAFVIPRVLASGSADEVEPSAGPLFVAVTSILVISYLLSLISFTTAWHRTVLGGPSDGGSWLRLGRPEWRYLGYGLLLLLGLLVAQSVGRSLAGMIPAMAGRAAVSLAPLLLVLFLAARLILVLPATASGQALSLVDAWDLSRGNSLRLIGLFALLLVSWWLLALVGQILATAPGLASPWTVAIRAVGMIIGILYWGLIVTALSLCYRRLANGPPEQQRIGS